MNRRDVIAFAGFLIVVSLTDLAFWHFLQWPKIDGANKLALAAMGTIVSAIRDKSNA